MADTILTPTGSVSFKMTLVALPGPLLVTLSVYISVLPAITGSGVSVLFNVKLAAVGWIGIGVGVSVDPPPLSEVGGGMGEDVGVGAGIFAVGLGSMALVGLGTEAVVGLGEGNVFGVAVVDGTGGTVGDGILTGGFNVAEAVGLSGMKEVVGC